MKIKIFLIGMIFSVAGATAQTASEAEVLFNKKQYVKAGAAYEMLLRKKPADALNNYRLARCYYELKDYESAIKHFELSGNKYPLKDLYLGEMYYVTYRFEQSVTAYQAYVATLKPDDKSLAELEQKIKKAELGVKLLNRVEDIAIVDSVVVNKNDFLKYYKLSAEAGTLEQQRIKPDSKQSWDKIIYTTERGDRRFQSDSLKGNINLFSAIKLLDDWAAPVALPATVNTPANENYPFLMLDGITLYFASDGDNALGGYDIFITRYSPANKGFLAPENVGMPFNSMANDYMLAIDEPNGLGYFATDRNQPTGKVIIYTFVPNDVVTLVKTEDSELLRKSAMLKTYRKSGVKPKKQYIADLDALVEPDGAFEIIINDTTVYRNVSDFKNPIAVTRFKEWTKLKEDLKVAKVELDQKRKQYAATEKAEDKETIARTIITLERKIESLESTEKNKFTEICNEEIKFLNTKIK
jgi:tetratricopeptide (TPR) repeat protein